MPDWKEIDSTLKTMLRLKTDPIAFRRFAEAGDLGRLEGVVTVDHFFTFCQAQFMVRVGRQTVGMTRDGQLNERCSRLFGLRPATPESMQAEAKMLSKTWFGSPEEALKQQQETPRIPVGGAVAMAPLGKEKFDPEVVLIYGNPAQIMLILCGLQKDRYERFHFSFIGEGACADSLVECYVHRRPAASIPCYGERALGQVADDEMSLALPPEEVVRAISGMERLAKIGFRYPIGFIGGVADPSPMLGRVYR